jgi:hypothetical protein
MRQIHCSICNTHLTGGLDTFGDVGFELCQACHVEQELEIEADYQITLAAQKPCPVCGKPMTEIQVYPNLYHCWSCRSWWDYITGQGWTFKDNALQDKKEQQ